ncbi:DUF4864 domain-containing protein [Salinibius halmophilus]|uniref:DUF4864 domain-containing protein n=1 Tax=Salinibius halmophilus TaxID=1853216 RepID=UPI000E66EB24|nr:DUF4864 domain-containing protein [Salinibius halmophilus]
MRILLVALLLSFTSLAQASAEATVLAQIKAMQNESWQEAWTYASDGIRRKFGSAANFRTLVEQQYIEILEAVETDVKSTRASERVALVVIELLSPRFDLTEAYYILARESDEWRIISVELRPGPPSI